MCGFVAIYQTQPEHNVDLPSLLKLIRHRGPDDTGYYSDPTGRLEFGFVRLSIIDLQGGKQPISDPTGNVVVVCNGEIYNYVELTQMLQKKGYRFQSHGDIETIIHLYAEYGKDCLKYLEGMFSLAIWDAAKGQLLLARDPLGIKPLYYAHTQGMLAVASEMKPLLQLLHITEEDIDETGLIQYLSYGYTLAPHTLFKPIRKLPAGSRLIIRDGQIQEEQYWDCHTPTLQTGSSADLQTQVLEAFDQSIALHLRSDVPVAAFLSGGIDSGLIVARAARLHPRLKTYTIRFSDSELDESQLAEQVAKQYGTEHKTCTIAPNQLLTLLSQIVWACDEPLADSGLLPNFIINQLAAKDGVKVVLTGAGGDELFAGYTYYFPSRLQQYALQLPQLANATATITKLFRPDLAARIEGALSYSKEPIEHYLRGVTVFPDSVLSQYMAIQGVKDKTRSSHVEKFRGDILNAKLYADLKTYLTDDLMLLLDRMSMIHAVEGRVPFLHHPLVELAMGIPAEIKAPKGQRKAFLRNLARPFLPEEIFQQPKRGFNSPIRDWIHGELGQILFQTLKSEKSLNRPWWQGEALKNWLTQEASLPHNYHMLYSLFMLELYCRIHLDHQFNQPPQVLLTEL